MHVARELLTILAEKPRLPRKQAPREARIVSCRQSLGCFIGISAIAHGTSPAKQVRSEKVRCDD